MKKIYMTLTLAFAFIASVAAQDSKHIYLIHTSDTHSQIEPVAKGSKNRIADLGGTLRRIEFLKDFREKHPNTLLFDCGDIVQGTPYFNLFKGEVEVEMMNRMQYTAGTVGNHEFDFGMENLARLYKLANYPIVCCNYDFTGTELEGLLKPYIVVEKDGLKIGVLGLSPELKGLVQDKNCEGVKYLDPVECANKAAAHLKNVEHCDVVIALSHLGITNINLDGTGMCDKYLIPRTENIDVVLGGHSHTYMEEPVIVKDKNGKDVTVMHIGKAGAYVGVYDLTFDKE